MIQITYDAAKQEILVEGHSGYAPHGQDIVCAGVSGAMWMLEAMMPDHPKAESEFASGRMRICVPGRKARRLMERGMFVLKGIASRYRDNIRITEKY